jgi:hypothetical protein
VPISSKVSLSFAKAELERRYYKLHNLLEARELTSSSEGAGNGNWATPRKLCATTGNIEEIALAIEDLKSILLQISKYK